MVCSNSVRTLKCWLYINVLDFQQTFLACFCCRNAVYASRQDLDVS